MSVGGASPFSHAPQPGISYPPDLLPPSSPPPLEFLNITYRVMVKWCYQIPLEGYALHAISFARICLLTQTSRPPPPPNKILYQTLPAPQLWPDLVSNQECGNKAEVLECLHVHVRVHHLTFKISIRACALYYIVHVCGLWHKLYYCI